MVDNLTKMTADVNVISKLDNYPPDDPGMTPSKLKELFDKGSNTIKDFINNTLIEEINPFLEREILRDSAEGNRVSAENARAEAEEERETAESARISREEARQNAESARISREEARQNAESTRISREEARENAEGQRELNEEERIRNEGYRNENEYDRETAEGLRVSAETARKNAENLRVAAEAARAVFELYDDETEYVIGNKVAYQGQSYMCKLACTGIAPTNTGYWLLIAKKGEDGKKATRFVIGTSTTGWTASECDYLCDGTADQAEINAAITALPATGGEIVILDGTYNITAKIDVTKDNVSIRGNGNATILKRTYNSSGSEGIVTLTGASGCTIEKLYIDGNKANYTTTNNFGIYLASNCNDTTITGNTCNNSKGTGICLAPGCNDTTITGNTCNNNNTGIDLAPNCNDTTIAGNTCNNNSTGICLAPNCNDTTITGNTCNWNSRGIFLESSRDNTVTGNTCNNNNNHGIYLGSSSNSAVTCNTCNWNNRGIYLYTSSDNTVTGNTCNSNSNHGIYLEFSSNNTVTGNTCTNNNDGIYLYGSSSNNTVAGNTCIRGAGLATDYTMSQHTIQLWGTDNSYNLISNNNCMGKAVTNEGGTGNILVNNVYDGIDYAIVSYVTVGPTPPDKGLWLEEI
jgi:parallel beta-helix repeat protein